MIRIYLSRPKSKSSVQYIRSKTFEVVIELLPSRPPSGFYLPRNLDGDVSTRDPEDADQAVASLVVESKIRLEDIQQYWSGV